MFVTFEGPEGAGKSTILRRVAEALRLDAKSVVTTREPGATELGILIRSLLLEGAALSPRAELFLFLADRSDHVTKIIQPALTGGAIVLCDRFIDSTVAYQGHARGMDLGMLRQLNRLATDNLKPDLTLLFDLEPEIGLARIERKDRLDREPLEFHLRVRAGFQAERDIDPQRFVTIDASQTEDAVYEACLAAIRSRRNAPFTRADQR